MVSLRKQVGRGWSAGVRGVSTARFVCLSVFLYFYIVVFLSLCLYGTRWARLVSRGPGSKLQRRKAPAAREGCGSAAGPERRRTSCGFPCSALANVYLASRAEQLGSISVRPARMGVNGSQQ